MIFNLVYQHQNTGTTHLQFNFLHIAFKAFLLFLFSIQTAWSISFSPDMPVLLKDGIPAAQDTIATESWVRIDKIFIIGNRQTKDKIILRELDVHEGEQLLRSQLHEIIETDKRKIYNTQLFLTVDISIIEVTSSTADLIIRVKERWYTIPSPYVKLADRNLNEWFTNQGMQWNRLEYGLRFYRYNFRGRNEKLYLYAQGGFTKQFAFSYNIPYIDRAQKNGLVFRFSYAETNNIAFETRNHVLEYTDTLRNSRIGWLGSVGWTFRPSFYDQHAVNLYYRDNAISDTIANLNPNYFGDAATRQQYLMLSYSYTNDKRDVMGYPLKGQHWGVELRKLGLGIFDDINMLRLTGFYSRYLELGKGFYYAGTARGAASTPQQQPYTNYFGFGYDNTWPRGYELYVIEGQSYLLQQNTFSFRILSQQINLQKILPIEQFNQIPLSIYLKTYYDHGFVSNTLDYEQSNRLANRYLFGYGVGLDIVTYYDAVLRLEYSWNSDRQSGLRISAKAAF